MLGSRERKCWNLGGDIPVESMDEMETRYYVRVTVSDEPGVLAQVARGPVDNGVRIAAANPEEANADEKTAELVTRTHRAGKCAMQSAAREIRKLPVVVQLRSFLRVEA